MLRPHHGICLQFFEGRGYSEEFVINMSQICERLRSGARIRLRPGGDEICRCCPKLSRGCCSDEEKVSAIDRRTLVKTGLVFDAELDSREYFTLVKKKIIDSGEMSAVCGDCQWSGICINNSNSEI